ncbi:MAG: hypothetical protein A3G13_03065 [Candidatus Levybacteria bacterium RIFCSPLOWO2_12_FULL_37_7]|nr:MAG: hypothetical protein A3G13_03065 [Candidatus Levybacteria bacterium RIFCSPLOWO2_12_FULL_37_7]
MPLFGSTAAGADRTLTTAVSRRSTNFSSLIIFAISFLYPSLPSCRVVLTEFIVPELTLIIF